MHSRLWRAGAGVVDDVDDACNDRGQAEEYDEDEDGRDVDDGGEDFCMQ